MKDALTNFEKKHIRFTRSFFYSTTIYRLHVTNTDHDGESIALVSGLLWFVPCCFDFEICFQQFWILPSKKSKKSEKLFHSQVFYTPTIHRVDNQYRSWRWINLFDIWFTWTFCMFFWWWTTFLQLFQTKNHGLMRSFFHTTTICRLTDQYGSSWWVNHFDIWIILSFFTFFRWRLMPSTIYNIL